MKHEGLRVTWRGSRLRLNASLWLWPMGGPLTLPLRDPCVFGRWHGGGGSGDAIRPWWRGGGHGPLCAPSSAPRLSLAAPRAGGAQSAPGTLVPHAPPSVFGLHGDLRGRASSLPVGVSGLLPKGHTPAGGSVCRLPAQGFSVPRVVTAARVVLEPWVVSSSEDTATSFLSAAPPSALWPGSAARWSCGAGSLSTSRKLNPISAGSHLSGRCSFKLSPNAELLVKNV